MVPENVPDPVTLTISEPVSIVAFNEVLPLILPRSSTVPLNEVVAEPALVVTVVEVLKLDPNWLEIVNVAGTVAVRSNVSPRQLNKVTVIVPS